MASFHSGIFTQCFSGAIPITGAFLNHQWLVLIYDINCTGSEQTLQDCPYNGDTDHLCQPGEAASLICQSEYSKLVSLCCQELFWHTYLPREICIPFSSNATQCMYQAH